MPVSIDAQIACVKREISMREYVYPNQVARGKMTTKQAEDGIAAMKAVLNTLIMAERAHLDKSWNQPDPIPTWLEYPENKPSDEEKYEDFLIAYKNHRVVSREGTSLNPPKLFVDVSNWTGDKFISEGRIEITHFMPLPKLPKED